MFKRKKNANAVRVWWIALGRRNVNTCLRSLKDYHDYETHQNLSQQNYYSNAFEGLAIPTTFVLFDQEAKPLFNAQINSIESLGFRKSSPLRDYFLSFHWEDFRRRPKTWESRQRQRIQHIHHLDFDPCEEPWMWRKMTSDVIYKISDQQKS